MISILVLLSKLDKEIQLLRESKNYNRCDKLCRETRNILRVLKMFPADYKLEIAKSFAKMVCGFSSLYLDFKLILMEKESSQEKFIDEFVEETYNMLKDDFASIWAVIALSSVLSNFKVLHVLMKKAFSKLKKKNYDYDQYIRMIFVLHMFKYREKKSNSNENVNDIIEHASEIEAPAGLADYMSHHFPGYGWKGLDDKQVHSALLVDKQPKGLSAAIYNQISSVDTIRLKEPITNLSQKSDDSTSEDEQAVQSDQLDSVVQRSTLKVVRKARALNNAKNSQKTPFEESDDEQVNDPVKARSSAKKDKKNSHITDSETDEDKTEEEEEDVRVKRKRNIRIAHKPSKKMLEKTSPRAKRLLQKENRKKGEKTTNSNYFGNKVIQESIKEFEKEAIYSDFILSIEDYSNNPEYKKLVDKHLNSKKTTQKRVLSYLKS